MSKRARLLNLEILVSAMGVAESGMNQPDDAVIRAVRIWEVIAAKHCKDWRTADKVQQAHILRDVLHRAYVLVSDKLAGRN